MLKLSILYGYPDDPDAFEEYYARHHLPLARADVDNFATGGATLLVAEEDIPS